MEKINTEVTTSDGIPSFISDNPSFSEADPMDSGEGGKRSLRKTQQKKHKLPYPINT